MDKVTMRKKENKSDVIELKENKSEVSELKELFLEHFKELKELIANNYNTLLKEVKKVDEKASKAFGSGATKQRENNRS